MKAVKIHVEFYSFLFNKIADNPGNSYSFSVLSALRLSVRLFYNGYYSCLLLFQIEIFVLSHLIPCVNVMP